MRNWIIVIVASLSAERAGTCSAHAGAQRAVAHRGRHRPGPDARSHLDRYHRRHPYHRRVVPAFGEFVNASTGVLLDDGNRVTIGSPRESVR